jgi:hypothetical protein
MSLTPEEIAELQREAAEAKDLKRQLEAVNGNKEAILTEKKKVADELKELRDKEEARLKRELEEKGQFQELLKQANDNLEALRKENEEKDKAIFLLSLMLLKCSTLSTHGHCCIRLFKTRTAKLLRFLMAWRLALLTLPASSAKTLSTPICSRPKAVAVAWAPGRPRAPLALPAALRSPIRGCRVEV